MISSIPACEGPWGLLIEGEQLLSRRVLWLLMMFVYSCMCSRFANITKSITNVRYENEMAAGDDIYDFLHILSKIRDSS